MFATLCVQQRGYKRTNTSSLLEWFRYTNSSITVWMVFVYLVQRSEKPLPLPAALCIQERVAVAKYVLHAVADGSDRDRQLHQPRAAGRS